VRLPCRFFNFFSYLLLVFSMGISKAALDILNRYSSGYERRVVETLLLTSKSPKLILINDHSNDALGTLAFVKLIEAALPKTLLYLPGGTGCSPPCPTNAKVGRWLYRRYRRTAWMHTPVSYTDTPPLCGTLILYLPPTLHFPVKFICDILAGSLVPSSRELYHCFFENILVVYTHSSTEADKLDAALRLTLMTRQQYADVYIPN